MIPHDVEGKQRSFGSCEIKGAGYIHVCFFDDTGLSQKFFLYPKLSLQRITNLMACL